MKNIFSIPLILLCLLFSLGIHAQESANAQQARKMFDEAYQMMYGPQGSQLQYSVNIVGLYKTQGTIWTKGKKSKFIDEKYVVWNDDVTYYRLERKKKTITIFGAHSEERDKYASKFKFSPDNYTYSIKDDPQKGYYITLKAKKNVKGIKEARVLLDHHTHYPINVRVKVGIFHTTIKISNFKVGGITDQLFVFPKSQYENGYKYIDKR